MGFCRGCTCVILTIVNVVFALCGLILAVIGGLLKWNQAYLEKVFDFTLDKLSEEIKLPVEELEDALAMMEELSGPIGIGLFVMGLIIVLISVVAFVGLWCRVRLFLIIYAALVALVIAIHVILLIVYGARKEKLLDTVRTFLKEEVLAYESVESGTPDSLFMAILMQTFDCCGYENGEDFHNPSSKFTKHDKIGDDSYANIKYPVPCCKRGQIKPGDGNCPAEFNEKNSNFKTGCMTMSVNQMDTLAKNVALSSLVVLGFNVIVLALVIINIRSGRIED